ncbi:hypothetical protein LCGC14_3008430 [marine sediment metagenome]|uniref:Uncharacterized protein n=1 Tax=marine sediment metagenome TaxID=412755 RepID=A0A0F8ZQ53_9ZZZZ
MSVEVDLRTLLLTLSTVTALVGTGDDARIRPDKLDQDDDDSQPAIIVEVDDERPQNDLTGTSLRRYADVTLRCQARTKAQARAVAVAVKLNGTDPGTGLAGYGGTVSSTVYSIYLEDDQTSMSPVEEGSDEAYYYVFSNYVVTWAEAA